MPQVDPETNEPMNDDPQSTPPEQRGGKREGDAGMDDTWETGTSPR